MKGTAVSLAALPRLFVIVVILVAFGKASGPFQTIVITLLSFIYAKVSDDGSMILRSVSGLAINDLIKSRDDAHLADGPEQGVEVKALERKSEVAFHINGISNMLIRLIASVYLVVAAL